MRCNGRWVRGFGGVAWLWLTLVGGAFAQVDLNTASQAELESLPGIGPAKALAILHYRRQQGPFKRIEALQRVPGIGPRTVERLRGDLVVHPPPSGKPASPVVKSPPAR